MKKKERNAKVELYRSYVDAIVAIKLKKNPAIQHLKEDLRQEGYIAVLLSIEEYNPELSLETTFIYNRVSWALSRVIRKEVVRFNREGAELREDSKVASVEETLEDKEDRIDLIGAISRLDLTSLDKNILEQHYLYGYTFREISYHLGIDKSKAARRVAKALESLRKELK